MLEIDEIEDDNLISRAFVEQYGALWLSYGEQADKLWDHLQERILAVFREQKKLICKGDVNSEPGEYVGEQMKLF